MLSTLLELWPALVELFFYAAGTVVLSGLGVYLEEFALETAAGGQMALGAWLAVMGAMAFYFGLYLLGYTELRPRLLGFRESLGE